METLLMAVFFITTAVTTSFTAFIVVCEIRNPTPNVRNKPIT